MKDTKYIPETTSNNIFPKFFNINVLNIFQGPTPITLFPCDPGLEEPPKPFRVTALQFCEVPLSFDISFSATLN